MKKRNKQGLLNVWEMDNLNKVDKMDICLISM